MAKVISTADLQAALVGVKLAGFGRAAHSKVSKRTGSKISKPTFSKISKKV